MVVKVTRLLIKARSGHGCSFGVRAWTEMEIRCVKGMCGPKVAGSEENLGFKGLKYTAGHINYGGRVTNDWDRRCIMKILNDFYSPTVMKESYKFSESGIYHQLSFEANHQVVILLSTQILSLEGRKICVVRYLE